MPSRGTPHKCFRCDDDLWDAFLAVATAQGTNRPDLLREWIRAYVARHQPVQDQPDINFPGKL